MTKNAYNKFAGGRNVKRSLLLTRNMPEDYPIYVVQKRINGFNFSLQFRARMGLSETEMIHSSRRVTKKRGVFA